MDFNVNVYHHFDEPPGGGLDKKVRQILINLGIIMASQTQHAADIAALTAQVTKAKTEILAKVAELEAALAAAGSTSAEVDAAMEALKAEVQGVDDLNPDAPTP